MNKILALKFALRCFTCGLLSLLPVLGIPFAFAALYFQFKAAANTPDDWHISQRYTKLGNLFAALGLFLNLTAMVLLGVELAKGNL